MPFIDGKKFACQACISGHRSNKCAHTERQLFEIRPRGRPCRLCRYCRERAKMLEEGQEGRGPEGRCTCFDLPPPLHTVLPSLARQERKRRAAAAKRASRRVPGSPAGQVTDETFSGTIANADGDTVPSTRPHRTDGFAPATIHTRFQSPEYTHTVQRLRLSPASIPSPRVYGVLQTRTGAPSARESSAPAPPILRLDGTRIPPSSANVQGCSVSHMRDRILSDIPLAQDLCSFGYVVSTQPFCPAASQTPMTTSSYLEQDLPLTSQAREAGQRSELTPTGYVASAPSLLQITSPGPNRGFFPHYRERNNFCTSQAPSYRLEQDVPEISEVPKLRLESFNQSLRPSTHDGPLAFSGNPVQVHSTYEYPVTISAHEGGYAPHLAPDEAVSEMPAFPAQRSWDGASAPFSDLTGLAHDGELASSGIVSYRSAAEFVHEEESASSGWNKQPHDTALKHPASPHLLPLPPGSHALSTGWPVSRLNVRSQAMVNPVIAAVDASSPFYSPPIPGPYPAPFLVHPPQQAFPNRDFKLP